VHGRGIKLHPLAPLEDAAQRQTLVKEYAKSIDMISTGIIEFGRRSTLIIVAIRAQITSIADDIKSHSFPD
jgi:hypothetical protein